MNVKQKINLGYLCKVIEAIFKLSLINIKVVLNLSFSELT